MFAVIKTGGKQYRVKKDDVIQVEKLDGAAGDAIAFDQVLMISGDGGTKTGSPLLEGAVVEGEVVEQGRGPKLRIVKHKPRKHYRRRAGHRQDLTRVKIVEILEAGQKKAAAPKKKAAAPKKAAAKKKAAAPKKAAAKKKAAAPKKAAAKKKAAAAKTASKADE